MKSFTVFYSTQSFVKNYKTKEVFQMKAQYLENIRKNINLLNDEQINLLFHIYLQLDVQCDFFMPEEKHIEFINLYYKTCCRRVPNTFKSLMFLLTEQYTYQYRYPDLLNAIYMIHNNYSFNKIINSLYYSPDKYVSAY